MAKYVLIKGSHSHVDAGGERQDLKIGTVVDLTEIQALAFADKFKSHAEWKAAKSVEAEAFTAANEAAEELTKLEAAKIAKSQKEAAEEEEDADDSEDEDVAPKKVAPPFKSAKGAK